MAKDEKKKTVTLSPQALLIYSKLVKKNKEVTGAKIKGKNVRKITGDYQPTGFMSAITRCKTSTDLRKNFFDLETYKLSSLVPEIRLYKVMDGEYIPFYFPTGTNINSLMEGGKPYSTEAVGIKSFTVNFEGTDPYTAKRFLRCNLTIYTDSLENIFKDNPPGYARLADLFTISRAAQGAKSQIGGKGGKASVPKAQTFNASKFEIGAVMGYTGGNNILTQEEMTDVEETKMSLRMTLIDHTINVGQDGSATIDVEYTARLSALLSSGFHDIVTVAKNETVSLLAGIHEADLEEAKDIEKPETKKSELESIERERRLQLNRIIRTEIFEQLESENKIYDIQASKLLPDYYEAAEHAIPETAKKPAPSPDAPTRSTAPKALPQPTGAPVTVTIPPPGEQVISYVNYGDFLDMIFRFLEGRLTKVKKYLNTPGASSRLNIGLDDITNRTKTIDDKIKDLTMTKVLLADLTIPIGPGDAATRINVANIPLSFALLQNIFFKELTNLNKNTLTATKVLNLSLKQILPKALSSFSFGSAVFLRNGVNITSAIISGDKLPAAAANRYNEVPIGKVPSILKRKTLRSHAQENDFYCIHQTPSKMNSHRGKGDLKEDQKENIFHFRLGADRGLVKNISFSKFDVQYKKESLMIESVNIYDELRMPYSANITMFGNCLFFPGSQIYIDPKAVGFGDARAKGSASYRLGLGGYYTVLKVDHSISGGNFSTNLNCSFGSWPNTPSVNAGIMAGKVDELTAIPGNSK
jgi:hypothetical protein